MTAIDFELFKSHQYCDNANCPCYGVVGGDNLRVNSRKCHQVVCRCCDAPPFSVRRGTMFYGLRTPVDKIISCLSLLSSGMGVNAVSREQQVTADSLRSWVVLAGQHVEAFTDYMQQNMSFSQVQIDEFWSFIRKKREFDRK
jgi:hypothetical protein